MFQSLFIFLATLLFSLPASGSDASGTVPFIFDDNRVFAELDFVRPNGTLRKAVAYVDLGTPKMTIDEKLRRELQPDPGRPLILRIGNLETQISSAELETDTGLGFTGLRGKRTIPVEAVLSGSVLKNYQVVFDYAKQTLTIARPGTLKNSGVAVPCRVNQKTGLISVTASVAEHPFAIAIDCGSAYTWIRKQTAEEWIRDHPDWKRGIGAVGEANMQTNTDGTEASAIILRVPDLRLGSLQLNQVGVLGISKQAPPVPPVPGEAAVGGDFFEWYSKKAPEPVIGWIGGNVLKNFRVTIDFPHNTTYWERQTELDPNDLDQVGVTLVKRDDGYFIAGIAQKNGKPTVSGVETGDRLIQVDDLQLAGATRGAIFAGLHGRPGSVRKLIVERDGKRLTVLAMVTAF
jgi:hypothetical protein